MSGKQDGDRGGEGGARKAQVAEQLRRNLQRRKAQSRNRAEAGKNAAADDNGTANRDDPDGRGR